MWQIVGVLSDAERARGNPRHPVHGPMPRKVWRDTGKRYKMQMPRSNARARIARNIDQDDRLAIQYAEWLAVRDGIEFTGDHRCVIYSGVNNHRTFQKRQRAVTLGNVSIMLPNWDWAPAEPVCEIIGDDIETIAA